jgi:hypothetical protein
MPGGLMQLLTVGAQDQYLTVSPEKSYFKQVYKRPTNFSMQSVQNTFVTTPSITTGSRVQYTCKIPRVGDMLKDVILSLQLPDIYIPNIPQQIVNGIPQGQPQFRWISQIGNYITYSYSLIADTQLLDQKWGEYDDIWNELSLSNAKKKTYNQMVGITSDIPNTNYVNKMTINNNKITYIETNYSPNNKTPAIPGRSLNIPLNFWFSKSSDVALPLVALQYQVININVEFRMLEDLFQLYDPINNIYISPANYRKLYGGSWSISDYLTYGGGGPSVIDLNPYLECNYIFLDTPERTYIATNSFDCLVENVYRYETSGITNVYTIDLAIANPIKEILWITRRSDIFNYNDWTNLTTTIPEDGTQSPLATAKILWNGIDRFDIKDSRYFNLIEPYRYHTSSPRQGIYIYSFSLTPETTEPSGSYNASTINKTQLFLTVNPYSSTKVPYINGPSSSEYTVIVYAIYYNIFRVMSGTGGMVFAS